MNAIKKMKKAAQKTTQAVTRFAKDEQGGGVVEYAILVGLMAVIVITGVILLQPNISGSTGLFATIASKLGEVVTAVTSEVMP